MTQQHTPPRLPELDVHNRATYISSHLINVVLIIFALVFIGGLVAILFFGADLPFDIPFLNLFTA